MQNRLNTFILYKYYIELKYIYILFTSIMLCNNPLMITTLFLFAFGKKNICLDSRVFVCYNLKIRLDIYQAFGAAAPK